MKDHWNSVSTLRKALYIFGALFVLAAAISVATEDDEDNEAAPEATQPDTTSAPTTEATTTTAEAATTTTEAAPPTTDITMEQAEDRIIDAMFEQMWSDLTVLEQVALCDVIEQEGSAFAISMINEGAQDMDYSRRIFERMDAECFG